MVRVAVAGGTGKIGRHIVDALLFTKKHTVVVLARSSNPQLKDLGAEVVVVDYNDHASLVKALDGVHTVISAIWALDNTLETSQLALLRAAVAVGAKRFAPSEFAVAAVPDDPIVVYRPKIMVAEAVTKSGLEWTIFENGFFMNYFASGTKGVGYLEPAKFVVDVENSTAQIPGTGDQKICFTRGEDVGAFVAASVDLDKWPKRSRMVGDVKSYNEVVALAEKARGRKFTVTYTSEDELRRQLVPDPPSPLTNIQINFMLAAASPRLFYETANLNSLCPQVKPKNIEEFLKTWWN